MVNWEEDDLIDFDKVFHRYTNARTKRAYLGVTTFIGKFEPEFDTEYWSAREAVKEFFGERSYKYIKFKIAIKDRPREVVFNYIDNHLFKHELLRLQKEIIIRWKDKNEKAKQKGSAYHARQEDKVNFNKFRIINNSVRPMADTSSIPRSGGDKINLHSLLPDGAYAELLVKNHKLELSGQVDYCFIETLNGKRYVDIDDYKTNEILRFESYVKFLSPLQFLDDCNMNVYKIQLLLYAWMFEHYGFIIRSITITYHPDIQRVPKVYNIFPFRTELDPIKLMLDIRKRELKLLDLQR